MVVEALQIAGLFTGGVVLAFVVLALFALSLAWYFEGEGRERMYGVGLFVVLIFSITFFSILGVNYANPDQGRPATSSDDGAVHIFVPDIIDITVEGGGNPLERGKGNQAERDDGLR